MILIFLTAIVLGYGVQGGGTQTVQNTQPIGMYQKADTVVKYEDIRGTELQNPAGYNTYLITGTRTIYVQ